MMKNPGYPTADEKDALKNWLPLGDDEVIQSPLELVGYERNIERIANSFGVKLIAMMVDHGYLETDQDPLEAMQMLLVKAKSFDLGLNKQNEICVEL